MLNTLYILVEVSINLQCIDSFNIHGNFLNFKVWFTCQEQKPEDDPQGLPFLCSFCCIETVGIYSRDLCIVEIQNFHLIYFILHFIIERSKF